MSLVQNAQTKGEYLEILREQLYETSKSNNTLLSCSKCGELLINLIHGKYHDVMFHDADWKKLAGIEN